MTRKKILLVEDERIVALDIQNQLKKFGYALAGVVSSGEEAIKKAASACPDLVLMDIKLQGDMDGVEAGRQIYTRFHVPIVYLTAYPNDNTLARAKVTEASGYVIKPIKKRELYTAIEIALAKTQTETCNEEYLNHATFGLLYRVCRLENNQELFTSLYAMRYFFLVTSSATNVNFEPVGRTDACLLMENRLRHLRRAGQAQEYDKLFAMHRQTCY